MKKFKSLHSIDFLSISWKIAIMIFINLFLFYQIGYTQSGSSSWSMQGHDAQRTGRTSSPGPTNMELKWTYDFGSTLQDNASPIVGDDGTIYIPTNESFYAINPNGTIKWEKTYAMGNSWKMRNAPALSPDGSKIYAVSGWLDSDTKVNAINSQTGAIEWSYLIAVGVSYSSFAVDNNGVIYVGGWGWDTMYKYSMFAINPNGTLKWRYNFSSGGIEAPPAIDANGNIYLAKNLFGLVALDSNGNLKWTNGDVKGDYGWSTPAIGGDGTIYIHENWFQGTTFFALNPDGTIKWKRTDIGSGYYKGPAISKNGSTIYAAGRGKIYALDSQTGTSIWESSFAVTNETFGGSIALSSNDVLYIMGNGGMVYAASAVDGTLYWQYQLNTPTMYWGPQSPAIGPDGTLYIVSSGTVPNDGNISARLYAFKYTPNEAPSISITNPVDKSFFTAGSNIVINANASDNDGTVQKVEFNVDGNKIGEDINGSDGYSFQWNDITSGVHILTAKAIDNLGVRTLSTPIKMYILPKAPLLNQPLNNSTNVVLNPLVSWNLSAGGNQYHLQVSTNSNFSVLLVNDSSLTATSKSINLFSNQTNYYWRVRTKNDAGYSQWSDVWTFSTIAEPKGITVYSSDNLAGHLIASECNPGNITSCPCDISDVQINSLPYFGVVTANPNLRTTFVNAIGYKKFTDNLLTDLPIQVGEYNYSAYIKLPLLPKPNINQKNNPQAAHLMIQMYDGKNQIWNEGKISMEATIYWDLNPWGTDYGKIKIYSDNLQLIPTGITLLPDTSWHYLEIAADYFKRKYTSIKIDNQKVNLESYSLTKVARDNWGNDCSLNITTESENASNNCDKIFSWSVYYHKTELRLQKFVYSILANMNPINSGTITGAGNYEEGSTVSVTAFPATGYSFKNWTESGIQVSTSTNYTFTATANRTLVANFTINLYSIAASINTVSSGTITGTGNYNHGQTVSLAATPAAGYSFTKWTEKGTQVSSSPNYTFTATANRTLVANFTINSYSVAAIVNPVYSGTITGTGNYNHGQVASLTATPASGYSFKNWTENGTQISIDATYLFTANANRTLFANFTINSYSIAVSVSPLSSGTISGTGNYNHGSTISLSATAATGYTFKNWTENGTQVSTSANYTFTATENRTLVANFTINSYSIAASVSPISSGTVTGTGNYNHGSNVSLTAIAAIGYKFTYWTEGVNQVSANVTYSFIADNNRTLVANFTFDTGIKDLFDDNSIIIYPNPSEGIISIKFPDYSIKRFEIINSSGRTIAKKEVTKSTELMELMVSGIYTIKFFGKDFTTSKKIIIAD